MYIEILLLVLALVLATYLTSLSLALHLLSPSALERYLQQRGEIDRGAWLRKNLSAANISVSLLQIVARVGFFVLVLLMFIPDDSTAMSLGTVVLAGGITVISLWISSTIIAGSIARYAPVGLVANSLTFLRFITFLFSPLSRALAFIDETIRRLSGANLINDERLIEEELLDRIEDTQKEGALEEDAAEMIENIVEFRSTDVGEVMTPRTDIEGIELTNDIEAIREFIVRVGHSRIPIFENNLDHIRGVLYVKDLVPFLGRDCDHFELAPLLRQPLRVPETKPLRDLLSEFKRSEVHMAIVIDEYGGTAGLVTIEDVLEEIVGEIHDEHEPEDEEEPTLDVVDDTHAEVDGRFHIDDLNERLGLTLPENEEYETIAGFLMARFGHVPRAGEIYEEKGAALFTVLDATPTHVARIAIELVKAPDTNGGVSQNGNGNGNGHSDRDRADQTITADRGK